MKNITLYVRVHERSHSQQAVQESLVVIGFLVRVENIQEDISK